MPKKVISDYTEITSTLKLLKAQQIPVKILFTEGETTGHIKNVLEHYIDIEIESPVKPENTSADVFFQINKEPYYFPMDIIMIEKKKISALIPSKIEVWYARKYPRVNVYGKVFAKFKILHNPQKIADFQTMPLTLRDIYKELLKSIPDIPKVMKLIMEEINKVGEKGKLILYKSGEKIPTPALIAKIYKTPLFVEDTEDDASYTRDFPTDQIMSFGKFFLDKGWSYEKIKEEIEKLKIYYKSLNIKSIAYVPIILFNETVGHIECISNYRPLKLRDIYYLRALADIVSETIAKYKLFSMEQSKEFPIPVIDLGAGGLKFEAEQYMSKFIDVGTKLRIFINLEGKEIEAIGDILRLEYHKETKKLMVAVKFTEIPVDNQEYINKWVLKELRKQNKTFLGF